MKKRTALFSKLNPIWILFLSLTLVLTACQEEEVEFIDENNEQETVTANSALTNLISRTSQNDGDVDDILDGSDCIEIVLPITVTANGQKVVIEDEDDFDIIEDIFDQFPNDTDTLIITFPITVELEDFSLIVVNSQEELDALIAACENDDIEDTIDCVQFVYPLTFFTFNANNDQIGSVTVNSNEELFEFLENLPDDVFIALDYPITVIVNGEEVQVESNEQLFQILSSANCEDDDDDDDDEVEDEAFTQILTDGVWYVTYFFDDFDETDDFNGYEFSFGADGSAEATNGDNVTPGQWMLESDDDVDLELVLFFGEQEPLDELDEDWEILEVTPEIIRLRDVSDEDDSIDYLTFEREPNEGGSNSDLNALIETLTTDNWYVDLYLDDNEQDETCDYAGFVFEFGLDGEVVAVSDSRTVNGFWATQTTGDNIDLVLNFNFDGEDDPFEDLNDDWDVLSFNMEFIELSDVSGGDGSVDTLVFSREPADCEGDGGSAEDLRNILIDGAWMVALYEEDGQNNTDNYDGYVLEFGEDGTVIAEGQGNLFDGTWSVAGTGDLELILDFGEDIPFDEFTDEWDVLDFTQVRVELQDISGGDGSIDNLVLEKL